MRSVMVQFPEEQLERLDRFAEQAGVSRAQAIRDAVDRVVLPVTRSELEDAYRMAYEGPTPDDDWGNLEEWQTAASASRLQDDPPTQLGTGTSAGSIR
ncbi:MAG: ribbon-helix-helix protein, CopG family [Ilumatobacteraceae bacterium]